MTASTWAQDAERPYPKMLPLAQYLMDRNAAIALARSAAPEGISKDASVLVLTPKGWETAVKGTNGFVCMAGPSWTASIDFYDVLDSQCAQHRENPLMCLGVRQRGMRREAI